MTDRYHPYNANPEKLRVGDCVIRAISTALNKSWGEVYMWICVYGLIMHDMPSSNAVWGEYLKEQGFRRHPIDTHGENDYTVYDFCEDFPRGTFILALESHVICVIDGCYYDSWDSGDETPLYYWARID